MNIMAAERASIVFLDIDDVLCVNDPYGGNDALQALSGQHAQPETVWREVFAVQPKLALERMHAAMHGRLRYVISSSWRQVFTRDQIETVFRNAGLGFVADNLHRRWHTPCPPPYLERIDEIDAWLQDHHRGEPFVILDDDFSGPSLLACADPAHRFAARVVLCPLRVGLGVECVPMLVEALSRPCIR